jgi:fucose 4-O-acetylase-like acetyltransferase
VIRLASAFARPLHYQKTSDFGFPKKLNKMKARIYFLDNLRTFLIFLVIVLHAGLVYESVLQNSWIVSDPIKNESIGLIRMYLDKFIMFMIFFISGYFVRFSVQGKTAIEFLKTKFNRILLPWVIAVFTLIPAYKIIFLYSRGLPQEEWFTYFHLYERAGSDLSFFANNPAQNWLWFLPVLFLFQVIYLALSKTKLLSMNISLKTGVALVFIIGVASSMIISMAGLKGWVDTALLHFQTERILIYFMSFLLGALCNKLNVFESNHKNKKYYIISNVVLTVSMTIFTLVALNLFYNIIDPGRNYYFISEWADKLVYYISALLLMLSFLHVFIHSFRWSLNKTNGLMNELNKNSYSVYIIHVVVMGVFALILMKISLPTYLKYFILTILTFVVSNSIIYTYRRVFKKRVSKFTVATIIAAAVLLTISVYANQAKSTSKIESTRISQNTTQIPGIGIHEAVIKEI